MERKEGKSMSKGEEIWKERRTIRERKEEGRNEKEERRGGTY
jgi:hypothetical protein